MRLILKLLVLLSITANVGMQNGATKSLFPVTENGKYGYADEHGRIVIQPKYDSASKFKDGLAAVSLDRKYGFINQLGELVIPLQYDDAEDFNEGLAVVGNDRRWGYVDTKGREIIPLQFVEARGFSEGLAAVYAQSTDGRDAQWGYINKEGSFVIKPRFFKAFDFQCGVAKVLTGKFADSNKQGFIDKSGRFVIEPNFELAGNCSEDLIPVEFGGKTVKTGERMYRHVSGKWGYVDTTGKVVIPPTFASANEFSEGMAYVGVGDKYGYIDRTGTLVIQPQFKWSSNSYRCAHFVEGRACFERDGKIGYIDETGRIVIEPEFELVAPFSGGLAPVDFGLLPGSEGDRFPITNNQGLIDKSGKVIYKPTNVGRVIPKQSAPVDEKDYEGWQKVEVDWFSFYVPKEMKGGKGRGIDTTVYRYEGRGLTLTMDIGIMAETLPPNSAREALIDGQKGLIWNRKDRGEQQQLRFLSALTIPFGANNPKSHFTMYIHSQTSDTEQVAEKIFRSLRFKLVASKSFDK